MGQQRLRLGIGEIGRLTQGGPEDAVVKGLVDFLVLAEGGCQGGLAEAAGTGVRAVVIATGSLISPSSSKARNASNGLGRLHEADRQSGAMNDTRFVWQPRCRWAIKVSHWASRA